MPEGLFRLYEDLATLRLVEVDAAGVVEDDNRDTVVLY